MRFTFNTKRHGVVSIVAGHDSEVMWAAAMLPTGESVTLVYIDAEDAGSIFSFGGVLTLDGSELLSIWHRVERMANTEDVCESIVAGRPVSGDEYRAAVADVRARYAMAQGTNDTSAIIALSIMGDTLTRPTVSFI